MRLRYQASTSERLPCVSPEGGQALDARRQAGHAALAHAFAETSRAANELGAYVVGLRHAEWSGAREARRGRD